LKPQWMGTILLVFRHLSLLEVHNPPFSA
jgi:hypothetical protein